jgi:hypothetical protein
MTPEEEFDAYIKKRIAQRKRERMLKVKIEKAKMMAEAKRRRYTRY